MVIIFSGKLQSVFRTCISGEQQVYKLSSDEFIIVDITSDDKQTAVHLYNKIRENINQFY